MERPPTVAYHSSHAKAGGDGGVTAGLYRSSR
jgi:hypothetical protein